MGEVRLTAPVWNGNTWSTTATFGWNSRYQYGIVQLASHGIYRAWAIVDGVTYGPFTQARATYPVVTPGTTWTNPVASVTGWWTQDLQRTDPYGAPYNAAGCGVVKLTGLPPGNVRLRFECNVDTPYIDQGGQGTFQYGHGYSAIGGDVEPGVVVPPNPDNLSVSLISVGEHDVYFTHNLTRAGANYRDNQYTVGVWDLDAGDWVAKNVGTNATNKLYSGLRHDWQHHWQFRCYRVSDGAELTALRQDRPFKTLIDTAECWWHNGTTWQRGFMWRHNGTTWEKSKITHAYTSSGWKPNRNNLDKQ
jgi:hypothetical protein